MMEKLGVVTRDPHTNNKTASSKPTCPGCGSSKVNLNGTVPRCDYCGTEPWEPNGKSQRQEGR